MESKLKLSGTTQTAGETLGGASVNQPKIEDLKTLRATVRAISSVEQIYSICTGMFDPGSERNIKNGVIADQLNDSPPFPKGYLEQRGQSFRHNASTGFLSGILDPAVGSPFDVVDQAQYLTSASLGEEDDPEGTKTEAYRRKFTKLLRSWEGWRDHVYSISRENVGFGYCAVVNDDPYDWRPEECRQDNFGVPDDTGQHARKCQFFGRKKSFLIHELIEKLVEQPEDAEGPWDREACVEALNEAMPHDRQEDGTMVASSRTFVDLVRDGNAGAAYDPKARTVDVYILLATEADGKVSKFMVTQKGGGTSGDKNRLLYESYDEFEDLTDVVMFYSLNPGSGTLYSSKGGGRQLINLALSQERGRNKFMDSCYLQSLVWMRSPKGMVAVQMKVMDQYAIIGSEAEIDAKAMPVNTDAWLKMDESITRYAEQKFGAYIPQKPSQVNPQKEKTATETQIEAQRETITRSAWLKRFFGQFGDEITMIAKKAGKPDTKDDEAKAWQEDLKENDSITPELLEKLVNQHQGQMIDDMTTARTQALIQGTPFIMASPFFDKYKTQREISVRTLGKEMTDRLMFSDGIDPTEEAAQINKQEIEDNVIRVGGSPNAVPTDNHKVHLKYMIGKLDQDEPQILKKVQDGSILQEPAVLDNWQTAIKHGDAHVGMWKQQAQASADGSGEQEAQKFEGRLKQSQDKLDAALKQAKELKDKQAQQQQEQQEQEAQQAGQQQPGAQEKSYGGMSEQLLLAWIKNYEKVPSEIKTQLEQLSGLRPEGASKQPTNQLTEPTEAVSQEVVA